MSMGLSMYDFRLKKLTDLFGSKDERVLTRLAEKLSRENNNPLLDIHVKGMPGDADAQDFDIFVAARSVIMGDIAPGTLPKEEYGTIMTMIDLVEMQESARVVDADWHQSVLESYRDHIGDVDQDILQLFSFLENGRPLIGATFGTAPDTYYSYLTYAELARLSEYIHANPIMTSDDDGFGTDLLEGIEAVASKQKDLWLTAF